MVMTMTQPLPAPAGPNTWQRVRAFAAAEPVMFAAALRVLVLAAVTFAGSVGGFTPSADVLASGAALWGAAEGFLAVVTRRSVTPNGNVAFTMAELTEAQRVAEGEE